MKPLVIYHANCWDGFCAAWIAHLAHDGNIEAYSAHHGTAPPDVEGRVVYMLDFCYKRPDMERIAADAQSLVVLDHHQTSEGDLEGLTAPNIDVRFDNNKSGARLAWEWFWDHVFEHMVAEQRHRLIPYRRRDFAPWLVDYTEDRDLWRHALPDSRAVNALLRSHPLDFALWTKLDRKHPAAGCLVAEGEAILRREKQIIDDHLRHAREVVIDGQRVRIVNATVLFSDIAGRLAEGAAFGACYFDRQDGKRQWSLRSTPDGVDVSEIAKRNGGGGHRHAAGYEETLSEGRT